MNLNILAAPASAVTIELNWFEICEIGFVKLRDSVRNDAIMPSVIEFVPKIPRLVIPAIAM